MACASTAPSCRRRRPRAGEVKIGVCGDQQVETVRLRTLARARRETNAFPLCVRAQAAPSPRMASASKRAAKGSRAVIGLDEEEIKIADSLGASLPIDEDELSAAFDFFDVGGTGKITAAGLKQRLGAFYKNLPAKEIKLLLGDGVFTKESLRRLLSSNELGSCDPVTHRPYRPRRRRGDGRAGHARSQDRVNELLIG